MPKPPSSRSDRQRSSMESFLDEYQMVRLLASGTGLVLITVFVAGGWWGAGSPVPNFLVLGLMAGHAGWCRLRRVRAPRAMMLMDTTLLGAVMFTIPEYPAVMTATLGFLGLLVALFAQGRWMIGLLTYVAAWYVSASLIGWGVSAESLASISGSLLSVGAMVVVMIRVRGWLGRLDAERSQMIGTVSHELRNNLTGVLGLTEVVGSMPDLRPHDAQELIAMVHQQAVDANEIVEDLLTTSRVKAAALTVNFAVVDLNAEVATVARRFDERGVGLSLADGLPSGWADALRVRQAVRNLLSNALRYGGPTVTLITRPVGGAVQVIVRDDGDGVPADDEDTIFLPYRRSTQGRRDESSIGLGLWICRHIARTMGGDLEYRRRDGFTEFILTVPTARTDQQPTAAQASVALSGSPASADRPGSPVLIRPLPMPA